MFSPQGSSSAAAISPLLMTQAPSTSSSSLGSGSVGGQLLARNSTKTLKCPKCNWHYKYQETLEIHMKEKHDIDGASGMECCVYCVEGLAHPKLARGESYSCGYKPYRCDLCKYSTTTKGNLSIHMQSDKHLNAVQESIPSALTTHHRHSPFSFANPTSSAHCGLSGHGADAGIAQERILGAASSSDGGGDVDGDGDRVDVKLFCEHIATAAEGTWQIFDCLICRNFSTSDAEAMLEHIELDRSAVPPMSGDIQNKSILPIQHLHGLFRCNLCPYSSSLKANFQLHTRTDKHLQRLQLINHIREGGDSVSNTTMDPLSRLSSMKNPVQVRCHLCQEILTCSLSLREHCENPAVHLRRLQYLLMSEQATGPIEKESAIPTLYEALLSHKLIFKCSFRGGNSTGRCGFSTSDVDEAIDHLVVHRGGEAAATPATIDDIHRGEDVLKNGQLKPSARIHPKGSSVCSNTMER